MAVTEMLLGAIIYLSVVTSATAQYRPKYPSPYLQREIFVLNLEDGFFGCQVNESVDVLQLFELSRLCDGSPQCFLGSDEVANELKCTDRNFCHPKMPRCINGVCLDNLCYCNDGFGGKGCEMPDENECKYRPCDIFAHCTNTMGSFYCSCFPGYEGDGFECHDINECEIPSLAAICAENAECCNLPGHFVCKCRAGYTGNATVACTDLDECEDPSSCGQLAQCENIPGSYRCFCPQGYDGDPFSQCYDLDECRRNPCGEGAQCSNTKGGYTCSCSRGYQGNPTPDAGCIDVDECRGPKPPCGKGAQCVNTIGGYYCQCPEGYTGNPASGCVDINECPHACGANAECINTPGSYTCKCRLGHTGDPYLSAGCHDDDECIRPNACGLNAQCFNTIGSYTCSCLEGYTGNALRVCTDIDECSLQHPCPENANCRNIPGSYECSCVEGYDGNAREACTRVKVDVHCQGNYDCTDNAQCLRGRCQCKSGFQVSGINCVDIDECRTPNVCGRSAVCRNTVGSYACECKKGYEKVSGSPDSQCRDVNECLFGRFPCGKNAKCINNDGSFQCICPDNLIGDAKVACKSPCSEVDCGEHASCQVNGHEAACICNLGYTFDPINIAAGCQDINECDVNHGPSGLCGQGAICGNVPGSYHCYCPPGFTGDPFRYCEDINECDRRFGPSGQCGDGAVCTNTLGSFSCDCPSGFTGNGRVKCQDINECSQAFGPNGKCGISAICTNRPGSFECRCPPGTSGDPFNRCTAVVQCTDDRSCRGNSVCSRNQCNCPEPYFGDDCRHPCDDIFCGDHATCQLDLNRQTVCVCSPGYTGRSNSLPGCIDIDECSSGAKVCGQDAVCRNIPGSYECICPHGFNGDPYRGCIKSEPSLMVCSETKPCPTKEECVSVGSSPQCVCKRGYTQDINSGKCRDINECTEVRDKTPCGQHAFCLNMEGSYICRCPPGHIGNPYSACYPELITCTRDNQCPGNTICLDDGHQGHHCGCRSPFVQEGEYCILVSRNCSTTNPCPENQECVYTGVGYGFCICPRGYTMDATGFCRDIDECNEIKDWSLCGSYAECVNLPGAYQCLCAPGYTGNPRQGCSRIEIECRGPNSCPANMECIKGQCQCLPPYVLEGQTCKHPCDWHSCGQYASCELSKKGGPRCVCIPGCTGDPNNACQDINECTADLPLDPNGPCSVGAVCINIVGGYQCECPPGTTGDAYKGGCRGATGCSSDRQCPRNAACDARGGACVDPCSTSWCGPNADCFADDHHALCRCRPGFSGNPNDLERGCASPCAGVWCGINAHCIVNSHNQGVCHCQQGFVGNPWAGGGCHPARGCSTSRPCGQSQLCVEGACVDRCQGVSCGVGSRCDINTGNCVCLPFFIGNPAVLCVPPLLPPLCVPGCGVNSHCTYSVPNRCQCNPGFTGNPYSVCGTTQRCVDTRCGENANCVEGPNRIDCVCPAGLQGNPFIGCNDVNECLGSNPCGGGANCINSVGSFLCACPSGTTGNPLFSCTPANALCEPGQGCACSSDASCSSGEICGTGGVCQDACLNVVCGQNANCVRGTCLCPSGMSGQPNNVNIGCSVPTEAPVISPNECESNEGCGGNSICQTNTDGILQCYDVCESASVVCGRNAICSGHNHQALCECPADMVGDPNDLIQGCQLQSPHECEVSANCPDSHICKSGSGGVRICQNVCAEKLCGSNAICHGRGHRPVCECPQGFTGDPLSSCHPHLNDRCQNDDECRSDEVCKLLTTTGIRDCVVVCEGVQCGPNAICEGKRHVAVCECRSGFTGDAYDIQRGCQPPPLDLCRDSSSCPDDQVCRTGDKSYKECFEVCETTQCGLNALCRGRDHQAVCECRPGFSGNPTDFSIGCQPVPKDKCKSNSNCPPDKVCRPTPAGIKDCIDVCQTKRCGVNALCLAANHKPKCECPQGFSGDPNRGCQADHCALDRDCPDSRICKLTRDGIRDCLNPCEGRRCGPNAQCIATGHSAFCECRDGFVGNGDDLQKGCRPRDKCKTDSDCSSREVCRLNNEGVKDCLDGCLEALCGRNALCSVSSHIVVCNCPSDYVGDPYDRTVGCEPRPPDLCNSDAQCPYNSVCRPDITGLRNCFDACEEVRCGPHATCVSDNHMARCECLPNYEGNAYDEIKGCQLPHDCNSNQDCKTEEVCRKHTDSIRKCVYVCLFDRCGPNAECFGENHLAVCRCPSGYEGNPIDPHVGCVPRSPNLCEDDRDCRSQQICQLVSDGYLDCKNACDYVQCGPNAVCSARNHQTRCDCLPDHIGDPYNLLNGCKPPVRDECKVDHDCRRNSDICKADNLGVKHCIDPCTFHPCGLNTECFAVDHHYECRCKAGFVRDPNSDLACLAREQDECKEDMQCPSFEHCKANVFGTLKCAEICLDFSCSPHADCIAVNHNGKCKCGEGFTGDPGKRGGCIPIDRNECQLNDDCASASECRRADEGILKCIDVCEYAQCGPNAVCVASGHVSQCQCPRGHYIGDPYDLIRGCTQVECLIDEDCPLDKSCAPENYCLNPCISGCGKNAICIAENHHRTCQCPAGMTGDAYGRGCKAIRFCDSHPCHPSAKCIDTKGSYTCQCSLDYIGDAYHEGCRHPNSCPRGDPDCRPDAACLPDVSGENMCKNPCEHFDCGPNAFCEVINHRAQCQCPSGFRANPDPEVACLRVSVFCKDAKKECRDNQACVDGQCRLFCTRDNECALGEKCINQRCVLPCFAHSGCPAKEACVLNGYCQVGCRDNNDCPYTEACIQNRCQNPCDTRGVCGPNAICTVRDHKASCECPPSFEGSPTPILGCKRIYQVCTPSSHCPPGLNCIGERCRAPCSKCVDGELCVNGICMVICSTDNNCPVGEVCINQYCQVGCRADGDCRLNEVCGSNRCTCRPGFNPTPIGCEDNNECLSNPCHPTAVCINSAGSYYCQCREGDIGDGYTGCRPQGECPNGDRDCPSSAACGTDSEGVPKCINPCDQAPCGPNAGCSVSNHLPKCFCPKTGHFTGDPYEQSRGCISVECLQDSDCSFDRQCLNFVCESPCLKVNCGPYGSCVVRNRQALCRCEPGYENNGQLTCIDVDECRQHPCHSTAVCENSPGSFSCRCPTGLTGNPLLAPGCHDPNMCFNGDSDCADSAACVRVKGDPYCRDPCESPTACGVNSFCRTIKHQVVCSCPPGTTGDPHFRCVKVECTVNSECKDNQVCEKNKCIDACGSQANCGHNTICQSKNHGANCRCRDGFYGDPIAGCRKIIPCESDINCPAGELCQKGICNVPCNRDRDCGTNERCELGRCISICLSDNDCPEHQVCSAGKCITVDRCSGDSQCGDEQACRASEKGYNDCIDPCDLVLCAPHAHCVSRVHASICRCDEGFIGDPVDRGCEPVECLRNRDCPSAEVCEKYECVDPCKLQNICGPNAYCEPINHATVCRCHEGYDGDPVVGCRPKDYCANRPCHHTAICQNKFGGYDCFCPPERSIGSPFSDPGCRGENECPQGDSDCPFTAFCDRTTIPPMCKNPCQAPGVCGINALCRVENHRAACYCLPGFTGNPRDATRGCVRITNDCSVDRDCSSGFMCLDRRCKLRCRSDDDCASRELCHQGQCVLGCREDPECLSREICAANKCIVGCRIDTDCSPLEACILNTCTNPCESPTACGTNTLCKIQLHRQQCTCSPGFTGNPNIACQRILPSCVSESDCPINHYCLDGKCRVECNTDGECSAGEKCVNNHCLVLCRRDPDCQNGEICIRNHCQVGCRTNDQCPDHLACVSNQCRDPCEGSATCGPNAECRVNDHRPVCSCREGFVGRPNANVGCMRPLIICGNEPCPPGYTCHNGRCRLPCNSVRDCAVNEKCIDSRCYVQCLRDRDCYSGEICEQNFCKVGCRTDKDCAFHEACINNQCISPCDSPTACGTNANCDVIDHSIHCACPPGLTGDPYTKCDRVIHRCDADDRCGLGRYCEDTVCRVTCSSDNECLDNEKCVERRCSVICTNDKSCPTDFICEYGQCISGCRRDIECPLTEACINNQCLNPCASPTACGTKAQCQPVNHRPGCTCLPEHTGDPRVECTRVECIIDADCGGGKICQNYRCLVGCRSDQGCHDNEVCISRQCQQLCMFSDTCGVRALCQAEIHRAICSCPPAHTGNPLIECRRVEGFCESNADCPHGKVCINKRCEKDVECNKDEDCIMGHICQKNKCFVGCRSDENCPLDEGCYNSQCQRVCSLPRACGQHARCEALNHRAQCVCLAGFTGNPQIECRTIGPECRRNVDCNPGQVCVGGKCTVVPGCTSDNDCNPGQICENTKCLYGCRSHSDCGFTQECYESQCGNPCRPGKCGINAECRAINHAALCRCPPDHEGDPKVLCKAIQLECHVDKDCELGKICISNRCLEGCRYNEHCPDDKACIQGRCDTPCRAGACGFKALCRASNHQAECTCPVQHKGNAKVQCQPEQRGQCVHNSECGPNEVCENDFCIVVTGCRSDSFCNVGEICENRNCIIGCRRDSDCTFDKACVSSRCVNPCTVQDPCGRNTDCRPIVHRPHCTCKSGFEGNPFDYCKEIPRPSYECLGDTDCSLGKICESKRCLDGCRRNENCPFNRACINRQCEDPCLYPEVCGIGAECLVDNHHPICTCPSSLSGDPNIHCVPVPPDHCYTDDGCGAGHICENNRCVDACRTYHTCPYDKDCVNKRCQDPCSFFGACGTGANCHTNDHKAVCTCPPGYTGDPHRSCIFITQPVEGCISDSECGTGFICEAGQCHEGCKSDYQCPPEAACVRRKCENVCSQPGVCGINAQCMSDNHRPICSCSPGYVGDARVECRIVEEPECRTDSKCPIRHICVYERCIIGCRSDENCGIEEACINRVCQNPCSIFGACGRNAICRPINHKPECSCPSGFIGNPNVVCEQEGIKPECELDNECNVGYICENTRCVAGCRHDNNCPQHLACVNRQCTDPCLLPNSCGRNAECHADNHRPICTCPSNFRGDAYIECRIAQPDVECEHDLECSVDKICENTRCIKGCRNDANCRFEETCINKYCQNPCSVPGACGHNAICKAINHDRVCTCTQGYTGNPLTLCSRIPVLPECTVDRNCSLGQICQNHRCIAGCRTDSNCPYDMTCLHAQCQSVCQLSGACGQNAHCTPVSHRPHCSCPADFTGDPLVSCAPIPEPGCRRDGDCAVSQICVKFECVAGCRSHSNCPFDKACVNRICQDPCAIGGICGINTQCHASDHKAVCACIPSYTGDPLRQCTRIQYECETDSHCGRNFVCVNHECKDINECLQGRGPCALGAICSNLPGGYKCSCPVGLDGDPYRQGCRHMPKVCRRDEDCKEIEACNRHTGECYEVCNKPGICGRNAQCSAANHHHECYCPPGLTGNPYIECSILETCGGHSPCSGNLQCLGGTHCGCPSPYEQKGFFCILTSRNCSTSNPCPEHEECVSANYPSGICVCPKGFVLMSNGICRDINECDQSPFPCGNGAQCFNTIGSYRCQCPPGTVGEPFHSGCQRREGFCQSDLECPQHLACDIASELCYDPCVVSNPCGRHAKCTVVDHSPHCECLPGHRGNPVEQCYPIGPGCQSDSNCPGNLICLSDGTCGCPGEFKRLSDFCILTSVNCSTTNPCPDNQRCVYTGREAGFCICPRGYKLLVSGVCIDINECAESSHDLCGHNADCINTPGSYECHCPEGYEGEAYGGDCKLREEPGCKSNRDCLYHEACDVIHGACYDVCTRGQPCGLNAICRGENHKTSCTCPPRYRGNPLVNCFYVQECGVDYTCPGNLICLNSKECGCPPQYDRVGDYCLITSRNCTTTNPCPTNEECLYTGIQHGFCVCPRGYELMENGFCRDIDECRDEPCAPSARCTNLQGGYRCYCPPDTIGDPVIRGCTTIDNGCRSHHDCPSDKECDFSTGQCTSPCYICGEHAVCTARDHEAICSCPPLYIGDPYDHTRGCYEEGTVRTVPPSSELSVVCLADGVQVSVELDGFNGVIYVKGHSQDPQCRRIVSNRERDIIDFKVLFNTCGLIHVNGEASFILVIQKHPKLMTYRARAYHIKCVYNTGEKTITLGFNVSMITTSGTIANTGPPPTCVMTISSADGREVNSAEIGDDLLLKVDVQPDFIYGGFARSCVAKTMEDNEEIQYEVTDSSGCATDPSIFGNWQMDPDRKVLMARFNAFKFPTSNNLRFQCNIRVCFGSCPPVNCDGIDAFGRKKRQAPDRSLSVDGFQEGALREEIMVQSNAILTFEKKENQVAPPTEGPSIEEIDNVCLPKLGLIISLVITTLLALVAVAVAISCWLMAYRRRPKAAGPLPHPPDFPNPLYTTPEPVAEPSPDYYPSSHNSM